MPQIGTEDVEKSNNFKFLSFSMKFVSKKFHGLEVPNRSKVKEQAMQYPF